MVSKKTETKHLMRPTTTGAAGGVAAGVVTAGVVAAGVVATVEDSLGDWLGDEQMEGGQSSVDNLVVHLEHVI